MSKHLEPDPEHLNPEQQEWFDNLASQGAHEYIVQLESENAALRDQLAELRRELEQERYMKMFSDTHVGED